MKPIQSALICLLAVSFFVSGALAEGNHFGWCNGVGNPHRGSSCGGSGGNTRPTTQPSQVPTSNQRPDTGQGPVQVPTTLPTQVIVVKPEPQQTITGVSPVPQVTGQLGPTITGTSLPPTIIVKPLPRQTFTGVSTVPPITTQPTPSFTGVGLPSITVTPTPPRTVVGYGPVPATITVQPIPQPSFTGVGAVPQPTPTRVPIAVPTPTPHGTPYQVPSLVPRQPSSNVPGQVPVATPSLVPQPVPLLVPRPRPVSNTPKPVASGGNVAHVPTPSQPAIGKVLVTETAGRQPAHNPPQFDVDKGGRAWNCLASGHGQRKTLSNRRVSVSGALTHVRSIDVLGRDLPALHPDHAECVLSVRRKRD